MRKILMGKALKPVLRGIYKGMGQGLYGFSYLALKLAPNPSFFELKSEAHIDYNKAMKRN